MEKINLTEIRDDEMLMKRVKEILLREDRRAIRELQEILEEKDKLSERVSPIIQEHLRFFKQNFPNEFKKEVIKITREQFREGQDEILNVLYPAMGKMIKRYISHQFQLLKDSIDERIRATFSQGIWGRVKATIFGIKSSDIILSDIDNPSIEEIYVVQRDSGLLMGLATKNKSIDQDVVAGMLTAIKAFVEDAFQKGNEDLELIEYDTHKIFTQNFHTYYIAVAMKGSLSSTQRDELSTSLYEFAEKELKHYTNEIDEANFNYISEKLTDNFIAQEPIKASTAV